MKRRKGSLNEYEKFYLILISAMSPVVALGSIAFYLWQHDATWLIGLPPGIIGVIYSRYNIHKLGGQTR